MYFFEIQEVLDEFGELSGPEIMLKIKERKGNCNRNSFQRALKKLVTNGYLKIEKRKVKGYLKQINFYSLK